MKTVIDGLVRWGLGLCLVLGLARQGSAQTFSDTGFSSEIVATLPPFGPSGVAWAPDGRMFIWQKNGTVRVMKSGVILPRPFLDFSSKVNTHNDNGMLGLAFDPGFHHNGHVYLNYVHEPGGNPNDTSPRTARLVRVTADPGDPDVALSGSEVTILGGLPVDHGSHSLGAIRFAEDGTMFVGNGDGADPGRLDPNAVQAQDLDSVRGKIFRINADGTAPGDNPFDDGTDSIRSKVWAYGVRNPYRFSLHPATGEPYFGDLGWNDWEEVDRGARGGNFGWPCYEGAGPQPGYQVQLPQCAQVTSPIPPIAAYDHGGGDLGAGGTCVIGGDFYTGTRYPQSYQGNYFYADYSGNWIHRLVLDEEGVPVGAEPFATGVRGPVCVEQGPDELLYYVSLPTGEIRRIRYNGPSAVASATPTSGYSPLQVAFSSSGSGDPSGSSLTYSWDFGDGATSSLPNPSHAYSAGGVMVFTAKLTVRNLLQQSASATVKVTVGSLPPTPDISTPADGAGFMPGQTVLYQGSAGDPDEGPLPPGSLSWTILVHHNTHVHTDSEATGPEGSFVVQYHGAIGTFSYEIVLNATDGSGLKASTSAAISILEDAAPPTTPPELAAAAGQREIDLGWGASTDNAAVTRYLVERCQGGGCADFAEIGTAAATAYNDGWVAAGTSYSYRVRARDASGNLSPHSNVASATTPATAPGLVAAYSFDEGAGTTVGDASGSGNTGTVAGAGWTGWGKYGGALAFNGTSARVTISDSASLRLTTGMTLEAWVKPLSVSSSWRDVIFKGDDNYFLEATTTSGGSPGAGGTFGGEVAVIHGGSALAVNAWTHLAATYDGAALRLYVNGAQVASEARAGNIFTSANPLEIGGDSLYGQYFEGTIDEVRIYNLALTPPEIRADMSAPIGNPPQDAQPPTEPRNLSATAVSPSEINLSWTASADNVEVSGYLVERCQGVGCTVFSQIGTTTGTTFNDMGLAMVTSYSYRVRARDAGGNLSQYSNVASATTPPSVPGLSPSFRSRGALEGR